MFFVKHKTAINSTAREEIKRNIIKILTQHVSMSVFKNRICILYDNFGNVKNMNSTQTTFLKTFLLKSYNICV